MVPLPVFTSALFVSGAAMLLVTFMERMTVSGETTLGAIVGVWAGLWLGRAAAAAMTEPVTEYLDQLPSDGGRLRTWFVDAGFVYLLASIAIWFVIDAVAVDLLSGDELRMVRARSVTVSGHGGLRALESAVFGALAYWTSFRVELFTRSMWRFWAFLGLMLEAVILFGLPILRWSLVQRVLPGSQRRLLAFGVLILAAILAIALRWHVRVRLRKHAHGGERANWAT